MTATKVFRFPARIAELGFSVELPADWIIHPLPEEEADFSNPTAMLPLAIVAAPHAALIFSFAARPAYSDGTLLDWARYLLEQNGLVPDALGTGEVGPLAGQIGEARQKSELGPMLIRFAFLEDGGRLINITLSAPEMLASAVQEHWFAALSSFALESPRGSTVPATPQTAASAAATATETENAVESLAQHALADDAASLEESNPTNENLRNKGVGLVPRVIATDDAARSARVAAGAILAEFALPYGWHVIDDGKRTLVFEPSGEVQINLNLVPLDGGDAGSVLDGIEAETRASYEAPEFLRLNQGRITALGVRNISDGDTAIEQYHLLVPGPTKESVLRARVTSVPARSAAACNLAELILNSVAFGPAA